MTQVTDPVAEALAQINTAAANTAAVVQASQPAQSTQQVVPATPTFHAPAAPRPMSLDDNLSQAGLNVDAFLSMSEVGFQIGKVGNYDDLIVVLDRSPENAIPCLVLRYGKPVVYKKTYDQMTVVGGGSWQTACDVAINDAFSGSPYPTADFRLKLLENAVSSKKTDPVIEAGKVLGITPSLKVFQRLQPAIAEMKSKGWTAAKVKLTHFADKNSRGETWGSFHATVLEQYTS